MTTTRQDDAPNLDETALRQRLEALASFPALGRDSVERFGDALRALGAWDRLRMNPYRFAAAHGLPEAEAVELFVHGAKVGLFDFVWNHICPSCGALIGSHDSVNSLTALAHCATCDVDVEANLDDQIEVAFALNPAIATSRIDPYGDEEAYFRYFFSPNFVCSERIAAAMEAAQRGVAMLAPDDEAELAFETREGDVHRIVSVERNLTATFETGGAGDAAVVEVSLLETGLHPARSVVAPGRVTVRIRNLCKTHAGAILFYDDEEIERLFAQDEPEMLPFLTGKQLLNSQSFRDLFRVQRLVPGLQLPLRSLTILFTDLKGSTELYDLTGDAYAYALVQEHYVRLAEAVRENSGAVIKTMGDAIMASFSRPIDAVRAAAGMIERIDALNEAWGERGHSLGLKVGLHEGPALAVNADDRLDYFGQTVNIAARVQGLAQAGEIWHTTQVGDADGVRDFLRFRGFDESTHQVSLKGVGQPVRVHQWKS